MSGVSGSVSMENYQHMVGRCGTFDSSPALSTLDQRLGGHLAAMACWSPGSKMLDSTDPNIFFFGELFKDIHR